MIIMVRVIGKLVILRQRRIAITCLDLELLTEKFLKIIMGHRG